MSSTLAARGLADVGPFAETTADHVTEFYVFLPLFWFYLRCADNVPGNCRVPEARGRRVNMLN